MQKGIWVEASIDAPYGASNPRVSYDLYEKVKANPTAFIEQHIGLSYEHYIE